MLVIGPTARRIAAGCCDYIVTRFPAGHGVPVCEIDMEWFADLAQKEIHAGRDADLRAVNAALVAALKGLEYDRQPGRYCDHSDYEACPRCAAAVAAIKLAEGG
jgi:hypothetical protein